MVIEHWHHVGTNLIILSGLYQLNLWALLLCMELVTNGRRLGSSNLVEIWEYWSQVVCLSYQHFKLPDHGPTGKCTHKKIRYFKSNGLVWISTNEVHISIIHINYKSCLNNLTCRQGVEAWGLKKCPFISIKRWLYSPSLNLNMLNKYTTAK